MPFTSQRSLIFAYFNIATALPPFVTLYLLVISVISFELFLLISIFLDMYVSIFLIFSDNVILSIFMFDCFYFSRFFYLTCCDLTVSLPLSLFILLPNSLTMYLSQTTTISLYLSLSLAQSPFYSPYRYYFVIGSPYLPLSLTFSLFGATSYHTSLQLCDIIPLLPPLLLSNQSVFFALSPSFPLYLPRRL